MRSKLLVLLCLPLASVAAAQDFRFAYASADLVSPEGLYAALDRAVSKHCRDVNDLRNLRVVQACEKSLMEMAVREIDHPQLTAYVESNLAGRS
jgi:UrcA family protein